MLFTSDYIYLLCALCLNTLGNRDIKGLGVKCDSSADCLWEGTVGTIMSHVANCNYTLLPCPKECKEDNGDTKLMIRSDLKDHVKNHCPNREVKCPDCGKKDTFANITNVHVEECEKKKLPCPNSECVKVLQRQNMKRHLDCCLYTEIPCKYRRIGCEVSMKRKDMTLHENDDDKLHLQMALDKLITLEDRIEENRKLIDQAKCFTFQITDFQMRKELKINCHRIFYISPSRYRVAIKVHANGFGHGQNDYVSVSFFVVKGDFDKELKWPFLGFVTISLLNQQTDDNHHSAKKFLNVASTTAEAVWSKSRFIANSQLGHDPDKGTQFLKDDTLCFRVSVELLYSKPWLV